MLLFRHLLIAWAAVEVFGPTAVAQTDKLPRIGVLHSEYGPENDAFRDKLRALGWIEGQNVALEYRESRRQNERLPELAADLVRVGVNVIVTDSSLYVVPARQATSTIPIVFCSHSDPVGAGHVASLARPGGNVTGVSNLQTELGVKGLELLTQAVPAARRIMVMWDPATRSHQPGMKAIEAAGSSMGVEIRGTPVSTLDQLEAAFTPTAREPADAVLVVLSPILYMNRSRLAELALQHHLPGLLGWRGSAEAGGLLSYGPDIFEMFRRCAGYVDKILKGAKPADLPVEQASKYEIVVNLKTARELGLTIPTEILARADEVIE